MPGSHHKATFARDKRQGGYLIRVEGPHANRFAERTVPVTRFDGSESDVTLAALVWAGKDEKTGKPVALYSFVADKKEPERVEF